MNKKTVLIIFLGLFVASAVYVPSYSMNNYFQAMVGVMKKYWNNYFNINAYDDKGYTQLHNAVRNNDSELVESLFSRGADLNIRDRATGKTSFLRYSQDKSVTGKTPLYMAIWYNYYDIARWLAIKSDQGLNESESESFLYEAITKKNYKMFKFLVHFVIDKKKFIENGLFKKLPPKMQTLFEIYGNDDREGINAYDDKGYTQLHNAVTDDDLELVKSLISQGANVNIYSREEFPVTPLYLAVLYHYYDIAQFLIKNGADVSLADNTYSLLFFAHEDNNDQMFELLLASGANIEKFFKSKLRSKPLSKRMNKLLSFFSLPVNKNFIKKIKSLKDENKHINYDSFITQLFLKNHLSSELYDALYDLYDKAPPKVAFFYLSKNKIDEVIKKMIDNKKENQTASVIIKELFIEACIANGPNSDYFFTKLLNIDNFSYDNIKETLKKAYQATNHQNIKDKITNLVKVYSLNRESRKESTLTLDTTDVTVDKSPTTISRKLMQKII